MWKKMVRAVLICFFIVIVGITSYLYYLLQTTKITIEFEESKKNIINPSRGFYYQMDTSSPKLSKKIEENQIQLILLTFDLKEETGYAISDEKMEELKESLQRIKDANLKVIFRAAYGFDSEDVYKDPSDIEIILNHINQIAPILNEYKDSMLCVQAGFLGPWGEWHHSNLLGEDEEKNKKIRNQIIANWLAKLEKSITINVRRPRFIRDAIEAGLDGNRLGIHNDALLAGDNDMGTYDDVDYTRKQELEWMNQSLSLGKNGGEMPCISEYTEAENAILEFEQLHLTYLNSTYNKEVLEDWKQQQINGESVYDIISRRLGYRLSLKECTFNDDIQYNFISQFLDLQEIKMDITLQNTGFAPVPIGYQIYIVADTGEEMSFYPVEWEEDSIAVGENKFQARINLSDFYKERSQVADVIKIGILVTTNPEENNSRIQFANDELTWEDGINYIGQYERQNQKYVFNTSGFGNTSRELEEIFEVSEMNLVIFKIGKADSIFLQSKGESILIDTGEDEDATEILEYLNKIGEKKIDYMILTHFDKDHVGGADKLLERLEVSHVYQPNYETDSKQYKEYKKAIKNRNTMVHKVMAHTTIECGDMVAYIYPPKKNQYEDKNDFSLVTSIIHGENTFLFTGDAEEERLIELMEEKKELQHMFLKVPHHGRYNDQLENFLSVVNPSYAVITCSTKNPPDDEVLSSLSKNKVETYLTLDGMVYVTSDGEDITIIQ